MTTYQSAGVDIKATNQAVKKIKKYVKATRGPEVLAELGLFGSLFDLKKVLKVFSQPVLVQSMDGVGTKMMIARMMGKFETIGQDLINHSVNDILTLGARPLTFLDYVAADKLKPEAVVQIVKGLSQAAQEVNCAIVGGETAEMPGVYVKGEYDLAGCITGVAEKAKIITGEKIKAGDQLLGLASSGLHTNGYSLVRKIFFQDHNFKINHQFNELETTLGEELLKVHRSYFQIIYPLLSEFSPPGLSHITGGGIEENIKRLLPQDLKPQIDWSSWPRPPIFDLIQKLGQVPEPDMRRTFNLGIGMVMIVPKKEMKKIKEKLIKQKEKVFLIGLITKRGK